LPCNFCVYNIHYITRVKWFLFFSFFFWKTLLLIISLQMIKICHLLHDKIENWWVRVHCFTILLFYCPSWRFIVASWSRKIKFWSVVQVLGTFISMHFLCTQTMRIRHMLFWADVFGWDSKSHQAEEKEMKDLPKRKEKRGEPKERSEDLGGACVHLYKQGAPKKQIFCCDARMHDVVTGHTNYRRAVEICGNLKNYQL